MEDKMFINIDIERLRCRMSRTEMAVRLQISPETLADWITRRQAIPADKLIAISELLGDISIDYLLKKD